MGLGGESAGFTSTADGMKLVIQRQAHVLSLKGGSKITGVHDSPTLGFSTHLTHTHAEIVTYNHNTDSLSEVKAPQNHALLMDPALKLNLPLVPRILPQYSVTSKWTVTSTLCE